MALAGVELAGAPRCPQDVRVPLSSPRLFVLLVAAMGCGASRPPSGASTAPAAGARDEPNMAEVIATETRAPIEESGPLEVSRPREAAELVVRCAAPGGCPPSVGLVVFPGEAVDLLGVVRPARCTGTLVAPDRVLTASHCLTGPERGAGARCEGAWVAFPATVTHGAEAAACARVEAVDPDLDDDVLLEDWALITLARPIDRPIAPIEAAPVSPGTIVTVVSVTPHPIYDSQHALDARLCRAETADGAVRQLGANAQRVGWLSGCPIVPGNSGSPVLDRAGRLRALVHGGSHPALGVGVTTALPRALAAAR